MSMPVPTVVMPVPQSSIMVVHKELSCLDISKRADPDCIHPQRGRWLADFVAERKLFANSLATAVVPTNWRLAIIYSESFGLGGAVVRWIEV